MTVPLVVFVTPPTPARVDETDPLWRSKVPEEESVPFWIVPLVRVTPPFWVWLVELRLTVPPLTVSELALPPSLPYPETFRVAPDETVLLPV